MQEANSGAAIPVLSPWVRPKGNPLSLFNTEQGLRVTCPDLKSSAILLQYLNQLEANQQVSNARI
jgi:hypothetical protein